MSLIRIAVETRLAASGLTIRELLNVAYFKRFGKPMPPDSLSEDVAKWEAEKNDIPYLEDFVLGRSKDR